jgi:hypothetical protein
LSYTGIDSQHGQREIGLYNTVVGVDATMPDSAEVDAAGLRVSDMPVVASGRD